jgi:Glycosyl hydrolase 36 superfamily, catalytic domain/Glycosyltransferase family 36
MVMDRRHFLTNSALGAAGAMTLPQFLALSSDEGSSSGAAGRKKAYGSGYFGEWIEDEFGLPAFHYTCDQVHDPKAATEMNPGVLSPTEHIHQVGNDRLVAIASNYGHVRVRQDEGAPKFLNDYAPDRGCYAGGFGYLSDGKTPLSTLYTGTGQSFDRIFGAGYFRKRLLGGDYSLDQVIFAPFGDDPVLLSQVTIRNKGNSKARLRWIEYWGCQLYQFSFRSFMESFAGRSMHDLRRDFAARFTHHFEKVADGAGLLEKKEFLGRAEAEDRQFKAMVAYLEKNPNFFLTAPEKNLPEGASFDDLHPPATVLVSLDAPADGITANGKDFFGTGGADNPTGVTSELDGDLGQTGPESALLLERKLTLEPGASRTLSFMYGYLPNGADLDTLVAKYRESASQALETSSAQWKKSGLRFSTKTEPWVEREAIWNHYSLRSGFTADSFFGQHIVSQASIYQYVMGFQGSARDPLQHLLPFIFSDPGLARDVLRYTLKEVRANGSIPYGIVGHGVPMPTAFDYSSDMPMWLIWAVSEYVLATRDVGFLDSEITLVYGPDPGKASVRALLERCYRHMVDDVGTGEHGLMRMLHDDWNDALVSAWVPPASLNECLEKGESVLNSAMAAYVFDYYARMLAFAGEKSSVTSELRQKAEEHRNAVRKQWMGKWFRRAWLGPTMGWLGEKGLWIEPQPWAIISGACTDEQARTLIEAMDQELRRPSPIGAVQISDSPDRVSHGAMKTEPGTSIAGGVWPSLNQTLIWALARVDGAMAWDEWKKNSFSKHAEVYPEIWYGTWSGPDVLNSALSQHPGETTKGKPFGWTDFPVLNMHTHACPLYSASKLMGLEFTEAGIVLAPRLPLESFRFDSPLLGLVKTTQGYEGWYDPSARNTWSVRLSLNAEDSKRLRRVEVNGQRIHVRWVNSMIELKGEGGNGKPLRWSVHRG